MCCSDPEFLVYIKPSYSYDADGNLLQKTSPAPNQTGTATQTISYCYDALNRVKGKAYSAQSCPLSSPVVTYSYDSGTNGIGHLTSLTDQAGTGSYSYDALGRIASEQRTIAGIQKNLAYTYNLDSSVATLTYPSGAILTYTPDSAGRILSAADNGNSINYVKSAAYDATGALTGFLSGQSSGFAGITNSFSYNKRLQPVSMSAVSPTATVFNIGYDFHLGNRDNGNVYGITNNRDTTRNQTFTYDALNRLTSAQNAGTDCTQHTVNGLTEYWGNSYGYDAWGNLLQKNVTKCSAENLSVTALANNQLIGYGYDAAGNMTYDATTTNHHCYDQENRITGAAGYTYTYDADGNRVEKSNGSMGTIYWYMSPGIVAESDLTGNLKSEYVFFDGRRVARKDFPGGGVSYYFSDELKTASVITDSAGNIKEDEDYYPWGGELQFVNNDSNHYKFGGHERDNETGLDYMLARYYSNPLGRFLTPDWAGHPTEVPYANFGNPQSLNLYTYGKNNPTTFGDPDGHDAWTWVEVVVTFTKSVMDTTAAENRKSFANFMTPAPPHTLSTPSPCPSPCIQNQNSQNNDSKNNNNSYQQNNEQGRDAQGKFVSKQPGQRQPGADAEKKGLDALGATKNTKPLSNGRIPDGNMPDGQKAEVKSGSVINDTKQLREMGEGAVADTGKPLIVQPTNPNVKVSEPAKLNKNLDIKDPLK